MDHRATKDRAEKEQEEVERLVRPSPKVKPPRHDKRRERVEVDHDPDLDREDKDLSRNFKDIGGSLGSRVLNRWAADSASPPKPEAKEPEQKKVKVRSKETGWVGLISEDTLKSRKNEYETVDDSEAEKFPAKQQQTSQPEAPKPEKKPAPVEPDPKADLSAKKELLALGAKNPQIKWTLDDVTNPNGVLGHFAETYPAENLFQGQKLPPSVKTIGDLRRVLRTEDQAEAPAPAKAEGKPGKKPKQTKQDPAGGYEDLKKEHDEATARLKEIKEELKEDPKSEGAKAELAAQKEALKTIQEVVRIRKELEEAKAELAKLSPQPAPVPQEPPAQPAETPPQPEPQAAPSPKAPGKGKQLPTAPPPSGPGTQAPEVPPAKPVAEDAPGVETKPETPAAPSAPQRRPVTPEEEADAINMIYASFPDSVASKLMVIHPPLHPDDVQALVSDYRVAKSGPVGNLDELIKKASSFYATDPGQVAPPKWVKDKTGNKLAFRDLPLEAQHKALRDHQLRTVAMSLAARESVSAQFRKAKAPDALADAMSDFMLFNAKASKETPVQRDQRAAKKASSLFYNAIGGGDARPQGRMPQAPAEEEGGKPKWSPSKERKQELDRFNKNPDSNREERRQTFDTAPVSDQAIKNILKASKDPAVQRLAVGYFQGQDYMQARKRFLEGSSPDAISERLPTGVIAKRLNKASDWLRQRSELYPANLLAQDTAKTFRSRVMKQLGVLQPEKAAEVQNSLDEYDNKQYDKEAAEFPKAFKKYQAQRDKAEAAAKAESEKYSARLKKDPDYDGDPPLSADDRLAAQGVFEPPEPKKPARYDLRLAPDELELSAKDMWDDFESRNASQMGLASRVAIRSRGYPFSTYPKPFAMGRTAVYWGVAPYEGSKPYEGWQQPHACELGEADYSRVLKAAREWLKSPMLSKKFEGVVRDTQLRAALDLALNDENLSAVLHPTLYNRLLARLAGVSEDETLLTVTASETVRNTTMSKKVAIETDQADKFLAGLDKIASVIQENYSEWGMDLAPAKALVNQIDKLADEFESASYGPDSMLRRQASVMGIKVAEVVQRDSDEKYMDTFKNPMSPHQTEADEPYMKAYKDDQSAAVRGGKSTTGKPLAK